MTEAFSTCGLAPPEAPQIRAIVGLSLPQAVLHLAPGLKPESVTRICEAFKSAHEALTRADGPIDPLYPGMPDALAAIEAMGLLLGIVTGKGRRGLMATLDSHGLTARFAALVTADDAPGKPHPGMALAALDLVGAEPENAVVIGDTVYDMKMAGSANTASIGVSWGYHPPDALRAAGAAMIVDSAGEIPAAVNRLIGRGNDG